MNLEECMLDTEEMIDICTFPVEPDYALVQKTVQKTALKIIERIEEIGRGDAMAVVKILRKELGL